MSMITRSHGVGHTDTGKKRTHNEDTFIVDDELGLYAVCDGVGGLAAGEIAADLAVTTIAQTIRDHQYLLEGARDKHVHTEALLRLAVQSIRDANQRVTELAQSDPAYSHMACTATVLLIAGDKAIMAHVGDSRLYLRHDDHLQQLSTDHTLAGLYARQGLISKEDIRQHPMRNVLTRAVGKEKRIEVDAQIFDITPSDRFLLCSDGFSDYLTNNGWLDELMQQGDFAAIPQKAITFANSCGGSDNITVIAVDIDEDFAPDSTEPSESKGQGLEVSGEEPWMLMAGMFQKAV